MLEPVVRQEE
jgi:hypothetical protein